VGILRLVLGEETEVSRNLVCFRLCACVRTCVRAHLADCPNELEIISMIILRTDGVWRACRKRSTLSYT